MNRLPGMCLLTLVCGLGCNAQNDLRAPTSSGTSGVTEGLPPGQAELSDSQAQPVAAQADISVELTDYAGLQEQVKQHAGKIVVLDIWSNSCLPCMQEFHHLVELSKKYPEQLTCMSMNVNYIGLKNKPPESELPRIKEFLQTQAAVSVLNFASTEPDSDLLSKFGVDSMPAVMLYDRSGNLEATFTDSNAGEGGMSYEASVIPKLEELLKATDAS